MACLLLLLPTLVGRLTASSRIVLHTASTFYIRCFAITTAIQTIAIPIYSCRCTSPRARSLATRGTCPFRPNISAAGTESLTVWRLTPWNVTDLAAHDTGDAGRSELSNNYLP